VIDESRIELTFKSFAQRFAIEEGLLLDMDVRVQREMFGHFAVQFRAKILADDLPPEQVTARQRVAYEVPASTWQNISRCHASRWYARRLVARWPVRYEPDPDGRGADAVCTFELERFRAYPQANVRLPRDQFGPEVLSHVLRGPNWRIGDTDA